MVFARAPLSFSLSLALSPTANCYFATPSNCTASDVIEADSALHPALFFFAAVGWSLAPSFSVFLLLSLALSLPLFHSLLKFTASVFSLSAAGPRHGPKPNPRIYTIKFTPEVIGWKCGPAPRKCASHSKDRRVCVFMCGWLVGQG